jgi:hypothetical protein
MLTSVPVNAGSASEIESKKKAPKVGKLVVIVKCRCAPSDEVHAVPAEGELLLDCTVRPVHGLHFPFEGTVKLLPMRTYVEELIVRQKSLAAESPGSMNANTDAPRIVITDLDKTRNDTSFPPLRKASALSPRRCAVAG